MPLSRFYASAIGSRTLGLDTPDLRSLTWTVNERPVVSAVFQTHTGVEQGLWIEVPRRGLGRHLHGSFVRAFYAFPFASIAGISTPATAWLLQAMTTGTIS